MTQVETEMSPVFEDKDLSGRSKNNERKNDEIAVRRVLDQFAQYDPRMEALIIEKLFLIRQMREWAEFNMDYSKTIPLTGRASVLVEINETDIQMHEQRMELDARIAELKREIVDRFDQYPKSSTYPTAQKHYHKIANNLRRFL